MAIRKINKGLKKSDYHHLKNNYNDSNPYNPSHEANLPTNFELKTITLEDVDQGLWIEFNKRFTVRGKQMPLIPGDAEVTSMHMQNFEQFDVEKGYLNGPFLIYTRVSTEKKFRTNPGYKKVLYTVPKMKAQGVVIEEYIGEGPINYELIYEFKFITDFREGMNQFEEQLNDYFRNKRNIFQVNNERFSVGPVEQGKIGDLEMINKEDVGLRSLYVFTFRLKVWCYTIDASKVQKRERPNTFSIDIVVKNDKDEVVEENSENITIERFETNNTPWFEHPDDEKERYIR
jgi:hypothetical protein